MQFRVLKYTVHDTRYTKISCIKSETLMSNTNIKSKIVCTSTSYFSFKHMNWIKF